jgi:putrescine aminotransferase
MATYSASELRALDQAHHIHPFTHHDAMHEVGTHLLVRGEGSHLIDAEGRRLLDGLAGLWCVNVGYNCTAIVQAVHKQMEELPYYPSFFNSTTEPPIRVAEFLAKRAPARLNRVIFSNSGSEANETALKAIRAYFRLKGQPQKHKILTRTFAYHGVTLATASMTGLPTCNEPFGLPMEPFIHVPGPHSYAANREDDPVAYGQWCLEETARIIKHEGAETIAALFAEPIQGAGGVIVPPPGYLTGLRQLCREQNILFVADEVITAFGRLGDWFASNLWNLDPDLLIMAKGLTSGYLPLGGTLIADDIVEILYGGGYFAHGFTYSGHPSCCAAALANLEVIESLGLIQRVRDEVGPYFQEKLASLRDHPAVGEVRGHQLIGAIELVPQGGKAALPAAFPLGQRAADLIREEGAIVRGIRDLIALSPPLIIERNEIDELFASIKLGLDRLHQQI